MAEATAQRACPISYRVDAAEPGAAIDTEWLLTNGLGGYAMGTALGANTRRYHGWLVAALRPPVARRVVLHSFVEELVLPDRTAELGVHQFGEGLLLHPSGWQRLTSFDVVPPHTARWSYAVGDLRVTRTLHLTDGVNAASITYDIVGCPGDAILRVRPLVPIRDFHALDHASSQGAAYEVTHEATGVRVERDGVCVQVGLGGELGSAELASGEVAPAHGATQWKSDEQWWRDFTYAEERARGQDWREDVFAPGVFEARLGPGASRVGFVVSVLAPSLHLHLPASEPAPAEHSVLARAAAQFVVRRQDDAHAAVSIIAGYPWFADWGRDAMISLPGLLLTTKRFAEARAVLLTFARHVRDGLLPNCFDDRDGPPIYNTADAGLWFINALWSYARATPGIDRSDPDEAVLLDAARAIVRAYRNGTLHGIAVGADGLLIAGTGDAPVTWMDAKRGGIAFTPRDGKPVELSALWYNALHCLADLLTTDDADELRERAGHTAISMQMNFWWPERSCLHDVLHLGEHDWEGDARLRPNQILAVSLPFSPLTREQQRAVVDVTRSHLLTPYGLRTLDPADSEYCARYEGDLMARDAAYHNGTVWPWLIGPYCEAVLRVGDGSPAARREVREALAPLVAALESGCLGQIAEVYDGDEPHRPSGCPAQAWSVAEVLRLRSRL